MMNIRRWIAATMLLAAALRADTIVVADREYPDVRVRELRDGTLWYEQNGRGGSMPADRIRRLAISDEPAFTAAESARAAGRWDAAIDSYQTALRSSNKPWLRLWSAARLVESANQAGRFDAGVAAWLILVGDDPVEARRLTPTVPAGKSGFLAPAAEQLEKALAAEQRASAKILIARLLLDVQRSRGDAQAQSRLAALLAGLEGGQTARSAADVRLAAARAALEQREFARVADELRAGEAAFVEPAQWIEARWLSAEAQAGLIGAADDPASRQDAALAYLRVVAEARNVPGRPRSAESLMAAAALLEKVHDGRQAARLYQQVIDEFTGTPHADRAAAALRRMKTEP